MKYHNCFQLCFIHGDVITCLLNLMNKIKEYIYKICQRFIKINLFNIFKLNSYPLLVKQFPLSFPLIMQAVLPLTNLFMQNQS